MSKLPNNARHADANLAALHYRKLIELLKFDVRFVVVKLFPFEVTETRPLTHLHANLDFASSPAYRP